MSQYIGLPGILSQSGEKYTWNRYSIAYIETAGNSATVSRTYNYSKKAASAYTRSGTTFTLTNPTSTTFENITAGKYLVNVANSSSTATSGETLYKVTKNAGREKSLSTSSDVTRQMFSYSYPIIYLASSLSIVNGYIVMDCTTQMYIGANLSGYYTPSLTSFITEPTAGIQCSAAYKMSQINVGSSFGQAIGYKVTITEGSTLNLTYTPYTAVESVGTLIDTVRNNDISAYPTNGIQDGYWYILQS